MTDGKDAKGPFVAFGDGGHQLLVVGIIHRHRPRRLFRIRRGSSRHPAAAMDGDCDGGSDDRFRRRHRGARNTHSGHGSVSEDEERIEEEIQDYRRQHDHKRKLHFTEPAHQGLKREVRKNEEVPEERHTEVERRARQNVGCGSHEPHDRLRESVTDGREHDGYDEHHEERLHRRVVHSAFISSASVLCDEHGARERQPSSERDEEEADGETQADRGNRFGAQASDPEGVCYLVHRLEQVA